MTFCLNAHAERVSRLVVSTSVGCSFSMNLLRVIHKPVKPVGCRVRGCIRSALKASPHFPPRRSVEHMR